MDSGFRPVGPKRTFEAAVQQIADRIRLGEVKVGDRLPSERDLAAAMKISRATLREAIQVLTEAEVVEVRPGSGGGVFIAADYVPLALVKSRSDLLLGEVPEVLEARRMLEPRVAHLAAVNAGKKDFDGMEESIQAHRNLLAESSVLNSEDRFLQIDTQFHLHIARATGNSTIVSLMQTLLRQLEIARDLALHDEPVAEWVIDIHERTLAAIRSADHERIEVVMDEHLAELERAWERSSDRPIVRPIPDFLRPFEDRSST